MQKAFWLSVLLICSLSAILADAAVLARKRSKVVVVQQDITGSGSSLNSQVRVQVGRVEWKQGIPVQAKETVEDGSVTSTTQNQIAGMVPYDYGDYQMTKEQVQSIASSQMSAQQSAIAQSIFAVMKNNGATTGFYTFNQQVTLIQINCVPNDGTETDIYTGPNPCTNSYSYSGDGDSVQMVPVAVHVPGINSVSWSMVVDASGRETSPDVKMMSTIQSFLYVKYTPLAVDTGLPQAWQYQNAGTLMWQQVQVNNNTGNPQQPSALVPIGQINQVQTNGFFDEPDNPDGSNAQLNCLVSKTKSGCNSPYPDVVSLMGSTGASGAIVDFYHRVTPVMNSVEEPPGSGSFSQVAQLIMNVGTRVLTKGLDASCNNTNDTYRNAGQYQMNLMLSATRYFVDADSQQSTVTAQLQGSVTSPVQDYDLSMTVAGGQSSTLQTEIIDPFQSDTSPLVSVGYLSPSSTVGSLVVIPPPSNCVPKP